METDAAGCLYVRSGHRSSAETRRVDRRRERQVVAGARRAHFEGRGIEIAGVPAYDVDDRLRETILPATHDLDGERAGKLERADLRGNGGGDVGGRVHDRAPGRVASNSRRRCQYAVMPAPLQPEKCGSEMHFGRSSGEIRVRDEFRPGTLPLGTFPRNASLTRIFGDTAAGQTFSRNASLTRIFRVTSYIPGPSSAYM